MKKKKRILIFDYANSYGGINTYLENLIPGFLNEFDVVLVSAKKQEVFEQLKEKYSLPYYIIPIKKWQFCFGVFQYVFLLIKEKIDVILASELTGSVLIRYLKLFLPWIKFICVIHANAREYTQHSRIFLKTISILNKISYLLVDKYVCVSNYLVNEYLSLEGIPRSRIAMIYNGLKLTDSPSFPKTRQKPWKIAYIGRLSHEKGFDIFLQVVKRFIPEINDYQFHIFGNGKYLLDQAKLVENGFPGLIKNHGFVSNLYDHLKKIDCVIVPSRTEGCPYNVLEAFSYEIPVISFDVGGLPELIKNNETGILCKFGDIDAMVFGIKKTKNADFRDYLVRNASEFMKRFSVEIMRKKYVDLIKSL